MSNNKATSETRPVGRPSTYPVGTAVTAFPTRVTQDTVDRLREMKEARKSPFDLDHNSIGAELHRIVEQAHKKFTNDRDRRASKAKPVVETETLEG